MRARDIHADAETLAGQDLLWSSVKASLAAGTSGESPRFERLSRGMYQLAQRKAVIDHYTCGNYLTHQFRRRSRADPRTGTGRRPRRGARVREGGGRCGRRLISIGYFFVGWKFPFRSYWATWVPMLTPAVVEKR
jgi:hypothetical protein